MVNDPLGLARCAACANAYAFDAALADDEQFICRFCAPAWIEARGATQEEVAPFRRQAEDLRAAIA